MLGKSPIKRRQRPDMTIAVDWDVNHQFKQTNKLYFTGDIILEVNGTTVTSSDVIKPYLTTNGRHVTLGYIPSGKPSKKRDRALSKRKVPSEGSRVKRARTLHDKVSRNILENAY